MPSASPASAFLVSAYRNNPQGWIVVFVMFLALSAIAAARASIGLAMPTLEQEFGWSKSFPSSVVAWSLIGMAITSPFVGNLLDRFGARIILLVGLTFIALALSLTAFSTTSWQFFLSYSLLAGIGFGIVSKNVASATIARHFSENRGLALGVANAGATAGHLALLPVMAVILTLVGWRYGYLFLAAACLLLLPLVWKLVAPHDQKAMAESLRRARASGLPEEAEPPAALKDRLALLLRNRTFLALLGSYTICGFTATGMIDTHFLPYTVACGIPIVVGASAYGVLAAFNMGGMALAGYLADRINRPILLATIYVCRGLSFILLLLIPLYDTSLIWVFAVVFGLFDYSTIPVTTSIVATHVGLRTIGLSLGILAMFHATGAAMGALLGGILYDMFQKYDWVWVTAIALALIAGLLALTIRENRPTPSRSVPQPA